MKEPDFVAATLSNPINKTILDRINDLALPDCWLVSGAVFQSAWNVRTGRTPTYGIKDYDIFYFDPDTSWDAEDGVIKRAAALFVDLDESIEVRNQARVHLWYPEKFGAPYTPSKKATDGIDRFLMNCAQVGIARSGLSYAVYAPHGLDDIERMIVRPNRTANFRADLYLAKAERWKSQWPELTILPAENGGTR
jgi:hypothetical protein